MELIELNAEDGKWLTKEPTKEWQRTFNKRVKVPRQLADTFTLVTDEEKADYERRRNEYMKQLNEEEE